MSSKVLIISRSTVPPIRSYVVTDAQANDIARYVNTLTAPVDEKYFLWPTEYPGHVTQAFGLNPQDYSRFGLPGHEGIDMRAPDGSKIFSCLAGVVKRIERNKDAHNYGIHVRITSFINDIEHTLVYAHLKSVKSTVSTGGNIKRGQIIGFADNTGNSRGSHLHFTLKKVGATASGETNYPSDIIDPTSKFKELK